MHIRDVFRTDISRRIEEVVKVDVADDDIVAEEIGEYVVTHRIEEALVEVLDAYRETIGNPSGLTNIWVSGFFGSGKSSFAKVLGYLLENRAVGDGRAAALFLPHCTDPKIEALLRSSWELAPALTVFLELSSSQDVTSESEGLVPPMFRALLARLDYAQSPKLAALEFDLETEGRLEAFEAMFDQVTGKSWRTHRHTSLAVNSASRTLHALDPATFPSAEAWSRDFQTPSLTAKWFVRRAVDMLERRGGGAKRLIFVVDEVSQYIARSIDRIRAMHGVAEEFKALGGRVWLVATGQERLEEVVEGLEGKQSELQRLRDRFPITVDLLPSDINEVVSRRVLDKREEGRVEIARVLRPRRAQLAANTRLASETRASEPSEDDLIRLYPLLPYQVQLLIDAVSKRRSQVRTSAPMGGSNRTVIKHAQQLITSARVGLGDDEVGELVTMDRSYELLLEVIPTSWRAEIDQVAAQYRANSTEAQVMKVIALVHDVPALPLTARNLAVMLHPHIEAESRLDDVTAALGRLVSDDRLRQTDKGFQLQSTEQKAWDQERREIALGLGDELRVRKSLLEEHLRKLTVALTRTFAIGLVIDGDQRSPGDVAIEIVAQTHEGHLDELRSRSRESTSANQVFWAFQQSDETWQALEELHRSARMAERHEGPKNATDAQLLAEEKTRYATAERTAIARLKEDLGRGQVIFRGQSDAPPTDDLRSAVQAIVRERIPEIYPRIGSFAAAVDGKAALSVLRADDLATLSDALGENGIGLTVLTASGAELAVDRDPLAAFITEVRRRADLGQVATGQSLERHFEAPPFGASVEVIQVLTAAAIRAGLVEVVYQNQHIRAPGDRRLDGVFRTLPGFRQTEIRPPRDTGPDAKTRGRLAAKLQAYTGDPQSPALEELARAIRKVIAAKGEVTRRVVDRLEGAGLAVPMVLTRARELLERLGTDDEAEAVTTAADGWEDLVSGLTAAEPLDARLSQDLAVFRSAREQVALDTAGLAPELEEARLDLADLLASGDYLARAGDIRRLNDLLVAGRSRLTEELAQQLNDGVLASVAALFNQFAEVAESGRAEALRPLTELLPPKGSTPLPAEVLRARLALVQPAAERAARLLEGLATEGRLVEIKVRAIVTETVGSEPELDHALAAIRHAALAALEDGKVVRLT